MCCAYWSWSEIFSPHGAPEKTVSERIFAFSNMSQHWDGTVSQNHSMWKQGPIYPVYSMPWFLMTDTRIQGINSHGIDLVCPEYSGFSIRRVNPLRAKFFGENINTYLHFMSFLHTNKTQVVEIPPRVKQGPAYFTQSISWLLMSWRLKEPGHQQP